MAKKAKKDEPKYVKPEDAPGRLMKQWNGEEVFRGESVQIPVDGELLTRISHEMKSLAKSITDATKAVQDAKAVLSPLSARQRTLVDALSTGTLNDQRDIYQYADEEHRTVVIYDAHTGKQIAERELEMWELQEEAFDGDEEQEGDTE